MLPKDVEGQDYLLPLTALSDEEGTVLWAEVQSLTPPFYRTTES